MGHTVPIAPPMIRPVPHAGVTLRS